MADKRAGGAAPKIETATDFQAAFDVSRETMDRLICYEALLHRWQKAVNLVSSKTLDSVWMRHFADSAQLLRLVPTRYAWLDMGSGAGFPGLVIAILAAGQPGFTMQLVESDTRKCAFLRDVARQTSAPVEIHNARVESAASQLKVGSVDVVTARALAPLGKLLGLAAPYLDADTVGLFPKGRDATQEVETATKVWRFRCELIESLSDHNGRIAVITDFAGKLEG